MSTSPSRILLIVWLLLINIFVAMPAFAQEGAETHPPVDSVHVPQEAAAAGEKVEAAVTGEPEGHGKKEGELNPVEIIMEHIGDSHEWHILSTHDADGKENVVAIPLPILLITDGHFDAFLSSAFEHGPVVKGDRTYTINRAGKIIEASGKTVLDFSITKNVTAMFLSVILLVGFFVTAAQSYKVKGVPGGHTSFLEPLVLFVRNEVAIPNIGKEKADKFVPYLLTIFFFIWINNILGLIPVFPFGANVTGNIAFTLVLALCTAVVTNVNGTKGYWSHMIAMPGIPKLLWIVMTPVELLGVIIKPVALMIRLFANITAGHILILSLVMLIFIYKSFAVAPVSVAFIVFLSLLEILVAALQAYIFTMLSALFIGSAVMEHSHDDHH